MNRVLGLLVIAFATLVRAADPFTVTARLERVASAWQVTVAVDVPLHHVVYADQRFAVRVDGQSLSGRITPAPVSQPDPADPSGAPENVFTGRFEAVYALAAVNGPVIVQVKYQGCSETSCFLPRTLTFNLLPVGSQEMAQPPARADARPPVSVNSSEKGMENERPHWLVGVQIKATAAGYMGRREFLDFLGRSRGVMPSAPRDWFHQFLNDPSAFLAQRGMIWTLLLMLLGGLLLNLTPCVLPMIPVNLAIIGAGAHAGSRRRGLALGAAYGAGIAVVYGGLGVVVVLTGSFFGALQSAPLFSGVMAVLFLVLALAMFDVIPLDLSRFQRGGGAGGGYWTASVAGGVSALLAGACVAPVVAAVLLLAGTLYHGGSTVAVLLPFTLGLGMALPWPLAGAGMAVLPKPGAWMVWVKYAFGVLIAVLGLYYGWLAYDGLSKKQSPAATQGNELMAGDSEGWGRWLAEARKQGQPLMLDFHASWCKNCHVMDRTTFRDPAVRKALEDFIVVRVDTEHPDEEPALGMVQAFGVNGLPTYVVVRLM